MSDIFFSVGYFSPRNLFACFFPLEISLHDIFFLKSPITSSKVKWSAPKIHQTFGQLTDSDLSIISKGFWNNRGQNSLGERGEIRFYLPLPGKSIQTDVWWHHNQIFLDGYFTKFYYPWCSATRASPAQGSTNTHLDAKKMQIMCLARSVRVSEMMHIHIWPEICQCTVSICMSYFFVTSAPPSKLPFGDLKL